MREKVDDINASPSKRIYKSIIPDYHFELGLCELIDNAIDNWIFECKRQSLDVSIDLDYDQGVIYVKDNSGGIKKEDMALVVSPGYSRSSNHDELIGIFGVGSKRAAVALAEDIRISSRHGADETFQVLYGEEWIKDLDNWALELYKVDNIEPNTTIIELSRLRERLDEDEEDELRHHLSCTYALFLEAGDFRLLLNDKKIEPRNFEKWSYPPGFEPHRYVGDVQFKTGETVKFEIIGGLTQSKEPSGGEYGAYFYCNNRLISRAYKGEEVGFKIARIGRPHPAAQLARTIVKLYGSPDMMPWNSSKSQIDTKHNTFKEIIAHVEKVLVTYATMSKRWSAGGGWDEHVFKYATGEIRTESIDKLNSTTRIRTPVIPRNRIRKYSDQIKFNNRDVVKNKPWRRGALDGIIAVEELPRLKLNQNNRLSLLILDSILEIAFKDFLVHEKQIHLSEPDLQKLMRNRSNVHSRIKKIVKLRRDTWETVEYFYGLRCDLIHKKSSGHISDDDLKTFKDTVKYILSKLMRFNFARE